MPSIIANGEFEDKEKRSNKGTKSKDLTPKKRQLRSGTTLKSPISNQSKSVSPTNWKSPRRCINSSPNSTANEICKKFESKTAISSRKNLSDALLEKPKWNPKVREQMSAVKEVLHLSTAPSAIVCREEEQKSVLDFCKACIEQDRAGSLYVCGCPGTGKTLSVEKVKQLLVGWVKEVGVQLPDVLTLNCTTLTNTKEIFCKILETYQPQRKIGGASSPLQQLQKLFSEKQQSSDKKMMLIVADELDYLITRDRAVLHDLFMLTTLPFSRCILIGIANAIDLADRFLPKLQSLNCKPMLVTFRAYSKDQILRILQQRLMALPYDVFQPQALELCARKVAAASGDMRKALCVCRSAIEMLETELRDTGTRLLAENALLNRSIAPAEKLLTEQEINVVRVDHMAMALSRTFKSGTVDTVQSLPQHQQIILCSAVKLFRGGKKDTTVGEMNRSYNDICKSTLISPAGTLEFTNMCKVLSDQGLLKLGQSREDKLKRVTLKVDEADITFALQVEFDSFGIVFSNPGHKRQKTRNILALVVGGCHFSYFWNVLQSKVIRSSEVFSCYYARTVNSAMPEFDDKPSRIQSVLKNQKFQNI
ncbi:CDC6 [Macleaya cordata]|uniref:Cell division control protein n=1 Tax=Macleaya cordata TaxID=56857 RepID=A0A200QTQ6_MACCD|nr:CDC6 [Macleaya cordata]